MTQLAEQKSMHVENFSRVEKELPSGGREPRWLDELRRAGIERFEKVGFPSPTEEHWRHTNFAPITRTVFELATQHESAQASDLARRASFGRQAACELVLVNGKVSAALSRLEKLPRGLTVGGLAASLETSDGLIRAHLARHADLNANPFVALNTGFIREGAFIHVSRGVTIEAPIHVIHVSTTGPAATVSHPRILFVQDANSEATFVESYVGTDGDRYFTNAVTEIAVADDARLDHCKLQQESLTAYHVATMQVHLGRQAVFISHSASMGSRLTRNDLNVILAGEFADATLNGLVLIGGEQHVDNHTLLQHEQPNCPSHELYKHVLDNKSSAVFKGKIFVQKGAQKTDSKQTSKSLLLSDDANMNSQPALEIYADDVKCTHGSTIGPVDEEMIFYLRSRGVSLDAARHLLTYAFAADVTRRIRVAPVRARIEDFMAAQHGLPQDLRISDLGAHNEAAT